MSNYVDTKELIHAKQWADGMAFCAILSKYRPELMWVPDHLPLAEIVVAYTITLAAVAELCHSLVFAQAHMRHSSFADREAITSQRRKISHSLDIARFVSIVIRSLRHFMGVSAVLLPRRLSNVKAIRLSYQYHGFETWRDLTIRRLSAAYMRQWIGSVLVQIMACRLFGAKALSKPVLGYCQLDH